jgi:methylmalonyl-CoA mutase C-terminal domain/subunit
MTLFPRVKTLLDDAGRGDVLLIGGGIIPQEDVSALEAKGIARLFGPGTPSAEIVEFITSTIARRST